MARLLPHIEVGCRGCGLLGWHLVTARVAEVLPSLPRRALAVRGEYRRGRERKESRELAIGGHGSLWVTGIKFGQGR